MLKIPITITKYDELKDIVLHGRDPFDQITTDLDGINVPNDENKELMVEAYNMIIHDQKNYQDNDDNFNKKSVDEKMMMIGLNYQTLQYGKKKSTKEGGGKRKRKTLKKAKKGKMMRKRKTIKRNKITKKRKLKNRRKTKKM